jgi:geranylgeranyl reductase
MIVTLSRRELGAFQSRWARAAGADVRADCTVRELDLEGRTAVVGGSRMRWRHLIGADGSDSAVRRALGLPSPRICFAAEYNLAGRRLDPLRVECDPALGGGYFWVFPHTDYTSVGAVAPKRVVRPTRLRSYLESRLRDLGVRTGEAPLEAATLEVDFRGLHFEQGIHLAGDAAGVPSALTAEGIYAALITGEEVARDILEPGRRTARLGRWLRVKRRHDRLALFLRGAAARRATLSVLERLARWPSTRAPMADWFLAG